MSRETPAEALGGLLVLILDLQNGATPCPGMSIYALDKTATLCAALGLDANQVFAAAGAQQEAREALYNIQEASRASPPS